jgi:hypothetical protein
MAPAVQRAEGGSEGGSEGGRAGGRGGGREGKKGGEADTGVDGRGKKGRQIINS